jgi:hypothetical protein
MGFKLPIIIVLTLAAGGFLVSLVTGRFSTMFVSWNRQTDPRSYWIAFFVTLTGFFLFVYLVAR